LQGVYAVQFFSNGEWVPIVVDDRFLVEGNTYYDAAAKTRERCTGSFRQGAGVPVFVGSTTRDEFWMMLLEKG
jgi:hypothetical protein